MFGKGENELVFYGERIRQLREERGFTLADFASKAEISISYLSEIERGAKKPSLKIIERLANTLNVPKNQLLKTDVQGESLELGDRLRLLREGKGLTVTGLASKAGISVSYLSEIERGNVFPAVHTLKNIARELETSITSLTGRGGVLGSKLRMAREEQGLTQAELARAAGVSPGLIGQVEHGRVQPSLQTVESFSKVLGVSPCYFIADDAGVGDMLQMMRPEVREILVQPQVQSVLRLVCDCNPEELQFLLDFIKLFKRSAVFPGTKAPVITN